MTHDTCARGDSGNAYKGGTRTILRELGATAARARRSVEAHRLRSGRKSKGAARGLSGTERAARSLLRRPASAKRIEAYAEARGGRGKGGSEPETPVTLAVTCCRQK
jgi:hypothetical protein